MKQPRSTLVLFDAAIREAVHAARNNIYLLPCFAPGVFVYPSALSPCSSCPLRKLEEAYIEETKHHRPQNRASPGPVGGYLLDDGVAIFLFSRGYICPGVEHQHPAPSGGPIR